MAPKHKFAIAGLLTLFFTSSSALALNQTSALLVAASHTSALNLPTGRPVLPLPPNVLDEPEYAAVVKLASGWPVVQQVQHDGMSAEQQEVDIMGSLDKSNTEKRELSPRAGALRVLVVGDSMTQGQQGDFTWRYRMWQWFKSQNVAVQFVGPYTGTFQSTTATASGTQSPPQPPPLYSNSGSAGSSSISVNGGYARSVDSAFLQAGGYNHFANWGRAMATDQGMIANVLQQTPADMILLALGFNDMGWFYSDCYGLINTLNLFINNARSVNPNIQIAIANVPQRTFIRPDLISNTTTYNNMLPSYISKWTTAQSPLHLVEFQQNYACGTNDCPAAYDGLHPNAWGEFQIAQAFSKSLIAGFGIGATPLAIPAQNDASVVRQIDTPANFKVFSSPQGVSATWDPVYGAYSYDVSVSINGGGSGWSAGAAVVNRWDSQWPLAGWSYAVSVRASCGNQHGVNTTVLTATATPQLAPPPNNVYVQPQSDGFTVSWTPPTGPYTDSIVEYNIIFWDTNPSDCNFITGAAFTSSPATIHGLLPGRNYLVAPLTWNANGQGLPVGARNVVVGSTGTPAPPSNINVVSNDATSIHMSWNPSSGAAGYEVFARNKTGGPYISIANTTQSCMDDYFLFPGTWNYQFDVAAWNGNYESNMGNAVIAPSPASTVTPGSPGPTCAAPPQWCPGFGQPYSGPGASGCAGCGGGGGSSVVYSSTLARASTVTVTSATTVTAQPTSSTYSCSTTTTRVVVSATPYLVCGSSSTRDPSPSPYSFQAHVTGNIPYGQLNPTNLVSAISTACTSGCAGGVATTTTTAAYVYPTTAPNDQTTLILPYQVTYDTVDDGSYGTFVAAVMGIVKSAQSNVTFDHNEFTCNPLPNGGCAGQNTDYGDVTQFYGPSYVVGNRFSYNPTTGTYSTQAGSLGFTITSHTQTQMLDCSSIVSTITSILGLIPEVGSFFGILGPTLCGMLQGNSGS